LPKDITFIHSEDLAESYPCLSSQQREDAICKENGAVFIIGIEESRSPDYDDWTTPTEKGKGLNGDLLVWNKIIGRRYCLFVFYILFHFLFSIYLSYYYWTYFQITKIS